MGRVPRWSVILHSTRNGWYLGVSTRRCNRGRAGIYEYEILAILYHLEAVIDLHAA